MVYIGIDNGVTGSIGIIHPAGYSYHIIPSIKQQDYTKKKKIVSRINTSILMELIRNHKHVQIAIERPMINGQRFNASLSAARALEAVLIVVEQLGFGYKFIDSKAWQTEMLPKGTKSNIELKAMSCYIGERMFPDVSEEIVKCGDADGILIAEWLKRFDQGTLTKIYKNP